MEVLTHASCFDTILLCKLARLRKFEFRSLEQNKKVKGSLYSKPWHWSL